MRSAPGAPLTAEEKRKQVEQALEYALDAAVIEKPDDVLPYVTMKLRVRAPSGRRTVALWRNLPRVACTAPRPQPPRGCSRPSRALACARPPHPVAWSPVRCRPRFRARQGRFSCDTTPRCRPLAAIAAGVGGRKGAAEDGGAAVCAVDANAGPGRPEQDTALVDAHPRDRARRARDARARPNPDARTRGRLSDGAMGVYADVDGAAGEARPATCGDRHLFFRFTEVGMSLGFAFPFGAVSVKRKRARQNRVCCPCARDLVLFVYVFACFLVVRRAEPPFCRHLASRVPRCALHVGKRKFTRRVRQLSVFGSGSGHGLGQRLCHAVTHARRGERWVA